MQLLTTLTLLACIAPLHALTPPKSHAAPTPSVRRRTALRVRGGDNATDALRVRGGTGKKAKKPRKRGTRRWPTYGRSSRDRSRRESRVDTPKAEEPVEDKPIAKDFNQLKEVPQSWIDRTINFLEAPVVFCVEIKFSRPAPDSVVDLCTGLNDVVPFKFADLADVLLRRHGLQIVDEAGVDVAVEVHILGLVRGALRGVVLGDPEPAFVFSSRRRRGATRSHRDAIAAPSRHRRVVTPSLRPTVAALGLNSLRTLQRSS